MSSGPLPSWWQLYGQYVEQVSAQHGLNPAWTAAVIQQESGGNPNARSPAGANGLMQVVGGSFDPLTNIQQGVAILAADFQQFGTVLGLAAYNAGPGNVQKYGWNIINPLYLISQGWPSADAYQVYTYITNVPKLFSQFVGWLLTKPPAPPPPVQSCPIGQTWDPLLKMCVPIVSPPGGPPPPPGGLQSPPGTITIGPIQLPGGLGSISIPGFPDVVGAIGGFSSGITLAISHAFSPFVTTLSNLTQLIAFAGSAQTWISLILLLVGIIITLLGIVLFAVSLLPSGSAGKVTRAVSGVSV